MRRVFWGKGVFGSLVIGILEDLTPDGMAIFYPWQGEVTTGRRYSLRQAESTEENESLLLARNEAAIIFFYDFLEHATSYDGCSMDVYFLYESPFLSSHTV